MKDAEFYKDGITEISNGSAQLRSISLHNALGAEKPDMTS